MKKTLLMAAAALAAGVISSQGAVYSQNIVGYANLACPSGGSYLFTCQFTMGVSNGVNEVFGSSLPVGTKILTWNGVNDYNTALYDPTDPNGDGSGPWFLADDATPLTTLPTLEPGKGFFMITPGACTNAVVGEIPVDVGSSNAMALTSGTFLLGSVVPYAGIITNGTALGGGINLNGLPVGTKVLTWNGVNDYNTALYDPTDPNGDGSGPWFLADDATPTAVPSVNVGQGFFLVPPGSYTWTNGLPAQ